MTHQKKLTKFLLCLLLTMLILLIPSALFAADGTVYLSGSKGNDSADGTSTTTPVLTFAKAKSLLSAGGTINVIGRLRITTSQDWSLSDITGATMTANLSNNSIAQITTANTTLTLSGITMANTSTSGSTHMIAVNNDTAALILGPGTNISVADAFYAVRVNNGIVSIGNGVTLSGGTQGNISLSSSGKIKLTANLTNPIAVGLTTALRAENTVIGTVTSDVNDISNLKYYSTAGEQWYFKLDGSNIVVTATSPEIPVAAKPSITGQPSGANYTVGDQAAALSVTASVTDGGTLSYQWYSNTTNSPTGASAIDGATAAAYTPGTDASGTTYYYCVVTNSLAGATDNTAISDIVAVTVVAVKQTCDTLYLDVVNGNDANIGTTAQDAVKTFGEAKKWLASDGTIYVCSQMTVSDEQTWSLAGLGNAKLARYGDFKGTHSVSVSIAHVTNGGRLTLENITIDGAGINAATADTLYMNIAKVESGGTLIMNEGTTLANAPLLSVSVAGGDFVMNGGLITGGYDRAVVNWGAGTFTMNGGEISGNQDTGVEQSSDGSFTMTGGIITNNSNNSGGGNNLGVGRGTVVITGGTISDGAVNNGCPGVYFWKDTPSGASLTIAPAAGKTVVTDTTFYLANYNSTTPVITVGAPLTDDLVISVKTPANGYKLVQGTGAYTLTQTDAARISATNAGYSASWDAAGNAVNLLKSDAAVIIVGSAEGTKGGSVTVPVTIANNPGFCSFAFSFNFDTEKLELTGITNGNVVGALTATNTTNPPYGLSFVSPTDVTTASGTLFNLHFTIKEGFADGACPISVYCKDNDPDNFCNDDLDTVPVNFVSGIVTVEAEDPGILTPPALAADITDNTVGQAVDLTFTDDEAWRSAITGITVNGSALTTEQYAVSAGNIKIATDVFTAAGEYSIVITATGYTDATVTQSMDGVPSPTTYSVTVDVAVSGGSVAVDPAGGTEGTAITVTVTPDSGKQLVAGSLKYTTDNGENYTEITATDGVYSFALPAADVTVTAQFEELTQAPKYTVTPVEDGSVYEVGEAGGISTMTVREGISGLKYFGTQVAPVIEHEGREAVVFVHLRSGVQLSLNVTRADFDLLDEAQAGFNVQAGDIVKVFIMDDLINDVNHNPILLQ